MNEAAIRAYSKFCKYRKIIQIGKKVIRVLQKIPQISVSHNENKKTNLGSQAVEWPQEIPWLNGLLLARKTSFFYFKNKETEAQSVTNDLSII